MQPVEAVRTLCAYKQEQHSGSKSAFPHVPQHAAALFDGKNSDGETVSTTSPRERYFTCSEYAVFTKCTRQSSLRVRIHLPSYRGQSGCSGCAALCFFLNQ